MLALDANTPVASTPLHTEIGTAERAAGMLFLLYAQPLTRIARMRLSQVTDADSRLLTVAIAADQLAVPAPFDEIVRAHLRALPNMNTSAHRDNQWLFPGATPGEPMHQATMMNKLRETGSTSAARAMALFARSYLRCQRRSSLTASATATT